MYKGQDELIKDMRNHDNNKQEWTNDELQKLYETQLLPKEFQISFMTVKWHELNLHQSTMKPQLPSVKEGMTSFQTISNGPSSWQMCMAVAECHEYEPFQIPRTPRVLFFPFKNQQNMHSDPNHLYPILIP